MADTDIALLSMINRVSTIFSFTFPPPPDLTNDIVECEKQYSAVGSFSDVYKGCCNGVGMARTVMIAHSLVLLNSLLR